MEMYGLFEKQVTEYHKIDSIDATLANPYAEGTFEALLWEKSWVDTVQWHLEDVVRPEDVDPVYGLQIKRRIDRSNQHRTDLVERIDDHYMVMFKDVKPMADAKLNTETPAWAVDRLSILALKIYHFAIEAGRGDAEHRAKCQAKLALTRCFTRSEARSGHTAVGPGRRGHHGARGEGLCRCQPRRAFHSSRAADAAAALRGYAQCRLPRP